MVYSAGFTAKGDLVRVQITERDSLNSRAHFYHASMTEQELAEKAKRDYPELDQEQRDALVAFVLVMTKEEVLPKSQEIQKCGTETKNTLTIVPANVSKAPE